MQGIVRPDSEGLDVVARARIRNEAEIVKLKNAVAAMRAAIRDGRRGDAIAIANEALKPEQAPSSEPKGNAAA